MIMDGDAELAGSTPGPITLVVRRDDEWKAIVNARRRHSDGGSHAGERTQIGRWFARSDLVNRYKQTVSRIRSGAFLGSSFGGGVDAMLELDELRREIHDEIMRDLGIHRDSDEGFEFTEQLCSLYGLAGGS